MYLEYPKSFSIVVTNSYNDHIPKYLLKERSFILIPTITKIGNLLALTCSSVPFKELIIKLASKSC